MIIAIALWHRSNPQERIFESTVKPGAQSNSSTGGLEKSGGNRPMPTPSTALSNPQGQPALNRNNPESIRKYMESQNVPVNFYGKVVDQDSNSLADVSIRGEVLHVKVVVPAPWGGQDENIPIDQKTDMDGRFEIHGVTGRALQIESIQKSGYEFESGLPKTFGASSGSIENPVIFKMWSTNIHEQLITGERKFQIVPDGRSYFINLTDGTIAESGGGDLKVWIKYPSQTSPDQTNNWLSEIDVIKGGLVEEPLGTPMYMAPADGYVPSFNFQQQIREGQRGSIGDKPFYITLENGRLFGRIQIDLIAPFNVGIPGLIRLSYAINPSGSRILR